MATRAVQRYARFLKVLNGGLLEVFKGLKCRMGVDSLDYIYIYILSFGGSGLRNVHLDRCRYPQCIHIERDAQGREYF